MSLHQEPPSRAAGNGVASGESRDPIGFAVAALNSSPSSELLDRFGLRRHAEQIVFTATRSGFRTATTAGRAFARAGPRAAARRPGAGRAGAGVFDLTPTEDEQMLVDVVTEFAAEVLRPAAAEADDRLRRTRGGAHGRPRDRAPAPGVPESLGGISEERAVMAGTLVAEALAHGDLGSPSRRSRPAPSRTAIATWGTDEQQQTYLPAFTGDDVAGRRARPHRAAPALRRRSSRPPPRRGPRTASSSTA